MTPVARPPDSDGGVGHDAHEPDGGAPVDESDTAGGQAAPDRRGGLGERRAGPGARATEHADGRPCHATLPSGTVTGTGPSAAGRTRLCRRTIVSAASLSWMESEKNTPTRAKAAAAKNAKW